MLLLDGYSDSLLEVDGEASIVANAKLATTANTLILLLIQINY
jgi:hypothetical protein